MSHFVTFSFVLIHSGINFKSKEKTVAGLFFFFLFFHENLNSHIRIGKEEAGVSRHEARTGRLQISMATEEVVNF